MSQSFEQQVANAALALKSAEELRVLVCAERSEKTALQARVAELESALTQAPYQAFLNEQRSHAKTMARVAELEALFQQTHGCHHSWVANHELMWTRIAQAVKELEHDDYPRHATQRALAILKGQT